MDRVKNTLGTLAPPHRELIHLMPRPRQLQSPRDIATRCDEPRLRRMSGKRHVAWQPMPEYDAGAQAEDRKRQVLPSYLPA
jgi:hypothetical protein